MRNVVLLCVLSACLLTACQDSQTEHVHIPDGADCQHVQYCVECGEQLAEQGTHTYAENPDAEKDGYLFYSCKVCKEIKIINEDGAPVVPVE